MVEENFEFRYSEMLQKEGISNRFGVNNFTMVENHFEFQYSISKVQIIKLGMGTGVKNPDKSRQKKFQHHKIQTFPDNLRQFQTFPEILKFSRHFQTCGNPVLRDDSGVQIERSECFQLRVWGAL